MSNEEKDLLDLLISDWKREREDLKPEAMGIVGRVLMLAKSYEAQADELLKPFGIRYTDLDVLATLRRSGSPFSLRPSELLASVLITSGSMTACLDRLSKLGLVERQEVLEDRRGRLVRLTGKGKRLIDKAIARRFEQAEESIKPLNLNERKLLQDLLRKLLGHLP